MIIKTIHKEFNPQKFNDFNNQVISTDASGFSKIGSSLEFYIREHIHAEDVAHLASLLFPDFYVKYDLVFLKNTAEPHIEAKSRATSIEEWQASFNIIRLWELFSKPVDGDKGVWVALLEIFRFSWSCSLEKKFPDKKHHVCCSFEDGYEPEIWFYQSNLKNAKTDSFRENYPVI